MSRRLRRQQPFCSVPDCNETEDLTVDHIVPVSQRPDLEFDVENLQVLCRAHNAAKGTTEVRFIEPIDRAIEFIRGASDGESESNK